MPTRLWTTSGTGHDDFLLLGDGASSANGGGGDDYILGDSIAPFTYGTTTSQMAPANLDSPVYWTTDENPFVGNPSIPYTSIYVAADASQYHYSSVTVGAGESITVDVDFGDWNPIGVNADLVVTLMDTGGSTIKTADDSDVQDGGAGSSSHHDSYLTYTNTSGSAQTYVIQFSEYYLVPFVGGESFVANISVTGHATGASAVMGNDVLTGSLGDDSIAGQGGDDTLSGGAGYDDLYGGSGDDTLDGGTEIDTAWYNDAAAAVIVDLAETGPQDTGGAGTDTITNVENLVGSHFNDALFGDAGVNFIGGGDGGDTILGYGGNDSLDGQDGSDTLFGGNGDDFLNADYRRDTSIHFDNALYGQAGNDNLQGWFGNDTLSGGDGSDTIEDGGGDDTISGGSGIDELQYSAALAGVSVDLDVTSPQFTNGAGVDRISGIENLRGSGYNDTMFGTAGANVLDGEGGNDGLFGRDGNDTLIGYDGNDTFAGGNGIDTASFVHAGAGVTVNLAITVGQDTNEGIDYINGVENLTGSNFDDVLYGDNGANRLDGGNGDDRLFGRSGDDNLIGGDGDDLLWGGVGDDTLSGGAGTDTASYAGATAAVTVSLALVGAQNTVGAGIDTLSNIQSLDGSSYNDTLTGNTSANQIDGGAGADHMSGGAGSDTYVVDNSGDIVTEGLNGGNDTVLSSVSFVIGNNVENLKLTGAGTINATGNALANLLVGNAGNNLLLGEGGNDTLTGGAGLDKFRFDTALNSSTNVDHITDLVVGDDRIQLDDDVFTAAGPDGTLAAAAFYTGSAAHDADDRIIYNSATGNLYYDPDGNGAAAQILFAHVAAGLAITNAEFQIIA